MKYYKDLIVWQKSMNFVEEVYKINFPKNEEYGLASQVKRASISIPSNIAEGNGRNSTKEYIRFLQISKGSLFEVQTQIELAKRLNMIDEELFCKLNNMSNEISAMLSGLIKKLNISISQQLNN